MTVFAFLHPAFPHQMRPVLVHNIRCLTFLALGLFAVSSLSCLAQQRAMAQTNAPQPSAPQIVHLDQIAFDSQVSSATISVMIKDVSITNASQSEADLRMLFSSTDGKTWADRFQKLTAQAITAGAIEIKVNVGNATISYRMSEVSCNTIHDGLVEAVKAGVAQFDVANKTNKDVAFHGTIQSNTIQNLYLSNYARLLFNPRSDESAPLNKIYDLAMANIITWDNEQKSIHASIDRIEVVNVSARQFAIAVADLPATLAALTATPDTPVAQSTPAPAAPVPLKQAAPDQLAVQSKTLDAARQAITKQPAETAKAPAPVAPAPAPTIAAQTKDKNDAQTKFITALVKDVFLGVAVERETINGIALSVRNSPNPQDNFDLSVANITLSGFGKGRIRAYSLNNLSINNADNHFALARYAFSDIDFSVLVENLQTMIDGSKSGDIAFLRQVLPHLGGFDIDGLDVDAKVGADKISEGWPDNKIKVNLAHFGLHSQDYKNAIPTKVRLALDHFVMGLPKNLPDLDMLHGLGYEKIDMGAHMDLAWVEADQTLIVKTLALDAKDMGSVNVSATFTHASPELFSSSEPAMVAAGLALLVSRADITLINDSLFDRLLADEAKNKQTTPEDFRKELILGASLGLPSALGSSPKVKLLTDALTKFIATPKSLHITASSKTGLGFSDFFSLATPSELIDRLDIDAKANE